MKMHINTRVIRDCQIAKSMADFYLNNYEVTLNPNTEILPLMGSKEGIMHISLALNEGDEVLIPIRGIQHIRQ
jgi:aspartate/methionine/tyrosine aminotransferase